MQNGQMTCRAWGLDQALSRDVAMRGKGLKSQEGLKEEFSMFGCCHVSQVKFRDEKGGTTPTRLDNLASDLRKMGLKPAQIEYVKVCNCPCHRDGLTCMC